MYSQQTINSGHLWEMGPIIGEQRGDFTLWFISLRKFGFAFKK